MLTALALLLAGAVLCLGLLIFIFRRGTRPMATAAAFRNVAWALGLGADTRGTSVQGYLDGRRLYIGPVSARPGERAMLARLELDLPLASGLHLAPRGRRLLARIRHSRAARITLGDPGLDEPLDIQAADTHRASQLLNEPVRSAIVGLLAVAGDMEIEDTSILVPLRRPPTSTKRLRALIDAMTRLATELEATRRAIGPPEGTVDWLPDWHALAQRLDLTLDPAIPALSGRYDGLRVQVLTAHGEHALAAEIRVTPPDHRPLGLVVMPTSAQDGTFTERFLINAWDPDRLSGRLTPEARAALCGLLESAYPTLTDARLTSQGITPDAEHIEAALRLGAAAVRAVHWDSAR